MKIVLVLATVFLFVALIVGGNTFRSAASALSVTAAADIPVESKDQPTKDVTLGSDSKSPKWKEVTFNHVTHSTLNYSQDGKSKISCVYCHHTDQPEAEAKKRTPFVTGQRDVILTNDVNSKADSKPVLSCRACHAQKGEKPAKWPDQPTYKSADSGDAVIVDNEKAYHVNCIQCHKDAKEMRADTIKNAPTACAACHKQAG